MLQKRKAAGLHIIIVGCGKVGATLVEQLSKEGHDITVIDTDSAKVQEQTNLYDVMGIVGNGASYSVQMDAGIRTADLIISVTGSDELNLLCCTVASRVANCSAIARVRTPDYAKEVSYLQEKLGLAMIVNPELEAAREMSRILGMPMALEVNSFAHGQAEMIKYKIPEGSVLDQKTLIYLGKHVEGNILICGVEREGEVYIPSGNFMLQAGDVISFVASGREIRKFFDAIKVQTKRVRSTMIVGGGKVAFYLAEELLRMGISVKIIERDRARCEELALLLPKAIIINGDGSDQELLAEEGLSYMDSFVPLTGMDEENIMLTLYAKQISKAKAITKVNRTNFRNVISKFDMDSVIYTRFITAEAIIAYVRAKKESLDRNIETLYHLFDYRVEAIEFRVGDEGRITNIPLKDLSLKPGLLIAFINRNGEIIIPSGQDCIRPGDTTMIVTTQSGLSDITEILA